MIGAKAYSAVVGAALALAPAPAAALTDAAFAPAPVAGGPIRLADSGKNFEDLEKQLEEIKRRIEEQKQKDVSLPELRIEAPAEVDAGDDAYHVTGYVGDDRSEPLLFFDGERVDLRAGGADAPDLGAFTFAFDYEVKIGEEGENRHIVEAEDAAGNPIAEEVVVRVVATNRPRYQGTYFALIIGNSLYDFLPPVETAVNDAKALAELLNRRYAFEKANTTVLLNATRRDILKSFSEFRKALGKHDRLLVYYSGHSAYDDVTDVGFWQAIDADEFDDFTWITVDDVRRNLKGMQAKHVLVVADAVFPLAVERGTTRRERDRYFEEIDSYVSRKLIASGVLSPTPDAASGGHSAFAHRLFGVLEENQEPYLTSKQLYDKLARELAGNPDHNPEWGTVVDAGDEGSGEFTFILRAKPLAAAD